MSNLRSLLFLIYLIAFFFISIVLPKRFSQVAGWGKTENGTGSDILLKIQVPVIMSRECKEEYLLFQGKLPNDDRQICAGGEEGKKHIKEYLNSHQNLNFVIRF